jgi:proton-dependent oligopeptide transporter, POT family
MNLSTQSAKAKPAACRTVFYGAVLVMCGHISLAIVPGLAIVAVGPVLVALCSDAFLGSPACCRRMTLGLAQYVTFRRNLGMHGCNVPNPLPRSVIGWVTGSLSRRRLRLRRFGLS